VKSITTSERDKAERIKNRVAKEIERIEAQRNLTAAGRQARLARAVVKAQDELTELRTAESQRVIGRRDELIRELFGNVSTTDSRIISIRDAQDRASRVTDAEEAARLMNLAEQNGDTVLLRALAQECAGRSGDPLNPTWGNLFTQWAQLQTDGADIVGELGLIGDELTDGEHRIRRDQAFSVTAVPDDLRGLGNLRSIAARADEEDGVLPPTLGQQAGDAFLHGMGTGNA
jgi:hypothetical protein